MARLALATLLLLAAPSLAADTSPRHAWRFEESFSRIDKRWKVDAGDWEFADGSLTARSLGAPDNCGAIVLKADLGRVTELQVDATLLKDEGQGLQVQFAGQRFFHYRSNSGIWPPYVTSRDVLKAGVITRLRLVRVCDRYEFWVDGRKIIEKTAAPDAECPVGEVRLWATYGATIRYDNLRVR